MKTKDYNIFKNDVIKDLTNKEDNVQYYLHAGFLWLSLTNKQCKDLRDTLRSLKLGTETEDGLKVGNWLLRD